MIINRKVSYSRRIEVYTKSGMQCVHTVMAETRSELEEKKNIDLNKLRERWDGKLELIVVTDIECFMRKTISDSGGYEVFTNNFTNEQVPKQYKK